MHSINNSQHFFMVENTNKNIGDNIEDANNATFGSGGAMVNESKYTTTLRGSGGGGRSGGDGGQVNSSPQGGGNGMVPVYAAGAAGSRRNHKGGAITYAPCWKGWFGALIVTSTYLLLQIRE